MKIKIRPFITPNYVVVETPAGQRQDGINFAPKFELKDVDEETLEQLCDDFKRDVFLKAGKQYPKPEKHE